MNADDIAGGFSDAEDMEDYISRIDHTTPVNQAKFNHRLANDGTKAGLLRLPKGQEEG